MWKIVIFQIVSLIIVAFLYAHATGSSEILDWSFFPDVEHHLMKK